MNILKNVLGGFPPNTPSTDAPNDDNVIDLKHVFQDVNTLKNSVEGLRFSKRDLAHELVLLVRENSRLEEQVYDMQQRIEKLEKVLKTAL